jgi:hypothetical protein
MMHPPAWKARAPSLCAQTARFVSLSGMPRRSRKPKPEDFSEAAFRDVPEATEERPEEPTATPASWTTPSHEETPPPKIL